MPEVDRHEIVRETVDTLDDAAEETEPVWGPVYGLVGDALEVFQGSPAHPVYDQVYDDATELRRWATDPQTAIDLVLLALSQLP